MVTSLKRPDRRCQYTLRVDPIGQGKSAARTHKVHVAVEIAAAVRAAVPLQARCRCPAELPRRRSITGGPQPGRVGETFPPLNRKVEGAVAFA